MLCKFFTLSSWNVHGKQSKGCATESQACRPESTKNYIQYRRTPGSDFCLQYWCYLQPAASVDNLINFLSAPFLHRCQYSILNQGQTKTINYFHLNRKTSVTKQGTLNKVNIWVFSSTPKCLISNLILYIYCKKVWPPNARLLFAGLVKKNKGFNTNATSNRKRKFWTNTNMNVFHTLSSIYIPFRDLMKNIQKSFLNVKAKFMDRSFNKCFSDFFMKTRRGRPRWQQTLHQLAPPLCPIFFLCDSWHMKHDT